MEKFTDLFNAVRNSTNASIHSCEPEIIELMRQIDAMIEQKQGEWQYHVQLLQTEHSKLAEENKSLYVANETLKVKIQQLEGNREGEKSHYTEEVTKLKNELSLLKRNYQKLLKKASNQRRNVEQDVDLKTHEDEVLRYKNAMSMIQSQQQALLKKCDAMQEQLLTYQMQSNKKTKRIEYLENKHLKDMKGLEEKLKVYQEKISEKDSEIFRINKLIQDFRNKENDRSLSRTLKEIEIDENCANRVKELEMSLQKLTDRLDMKLCELQVCNSQLESLRLENDHLKKLLVQLQEPASETAELIHGDEILHCTDKQEFTSMVDTSSVTSEEQDSSISLIVQEFIKEEKIRENSLNMRISNVIDQFNNNVDMLKSGKLCLS